MTCIWITRDEPPNGPLCSEIGKVGLEPLLEPVLTTVVTGDARAEIDELGDDDWLVLTSPRAIATIAPPTRASPRVAVVGEASAVAARARGLRVEFVSPSGAGAALWDHIGRVAQGRRVCFPRSSLSTPPALPDARLTAPVIYEVAERPFDEAAALGCAAAAFASPSAVRSVVSQLGRVPIPAAAIGRTTAAALRDVRASMLAQAEEPTFEALARALARALTRRTT